MNIIIRQETQNDYNFSEYVVEKAFQQEEHSDHKEQFLVASLRKSDAFVPELSLVAERNHEIVWHLMLTKIQIENGGQQQESLALAPVSVLPKYQNQGIGTRLIRESMKFAKEMDFQSVIVLGHANYYPRFGFQPASGWGIKAPFDVPDESFMALELREGSLDGVSGTVSYGGAFFE
jgi:predicted N-acetyltransferase YhbS